MNSSGVDATDTTTNQQQPSHGRLADWRVELDSVVDRLQFPQAPVSGVQSKCHPHPSAAQRLYVPRSPEVDLSNFANRSPSTINRSYVDAASVPRDFDETKRALEEENARLKAQLRAVKENQRSTEAEVEQLAVAVADLEERTAAAENIQKANYDTVVEFHEKLQAVDKSKDDLEGMVKGLQAQWSAMKSDQDSFRAAAVPAMTRQECIEQLQALVSPLETELRERLQAQTRLLHDMGEAAQVSQALLEKLKSAPERAAGDTELALVAEVLKQEVNQKLQLYELRLSEKIATVDKSLAWRLMEETKELDRKLANHSLVVANELNCRDAPEFLQRLQALEDEARKRRIHEVDYISKSQIRERVDELLAQANLSGVSIPTEKLPFVKQDDLEEAIAQALRRSSSSNSDVSIKLSKRLEALETQIESKAEENEEMQSQTDEGLQASIDEANLSISKLGEKIAQQGKVNKDLQNDIESIRQAVEGCKQKFETNDKKNDARISEVSTQQASAAKSAQIRDYKLAGLEERVSRLQRTLATSAKVGCQSEIAEGARKLPNSSVKAAEPKPTSKGFDQIKSTAVKEKSKEQTEKEARRQAELQAVRERLQEFEKKWNEGKVKGARGKAGGPSLPHPSPKPSPPAPPKALPIPVSAPPASKQPGGKPKDSSVSCTYCRRLLPGKNTAALHESMCERKPLQCKFCQGTFLRAELREHEVDCSQKMSTCKHCGEEFKTHLLAEHEACCDWIPRKCSVCHKVIIARDLKKHETKCKERVTLQEEPKAKSDVVDNWTFEEVAQWVEGVAPECAESFREFQVDGTMLADLKDGDLFSVLSINKEKSRTAILEAFEELLSSERDQ